MEEKSPAERRDKYLLRLWRRLLTRGWEVLTVCVFIWLGKMHCPLAL